MKSILVLSVLWILCGCATSPPDPIVVTRAYTHVVNVPSVMLTKCVAASPPAIDEYIKSDATKQESMLTSYIATLLTTLGDCNSKLDAITTWQSNQNKLFNEPGD